MPRRETAFEEVLDSQRCYRVLLDAFSRPGRCRRLPQVPYAAPPAGLSPHLLSVFKTLCDHAVRFAVAGPAADPWASYLQINTGSRPGPAQAADFVAFDGGCFEGVFGELRRGSLETPELGATAVVCVADLSETDSGSGPTAAGRCRLSLRGPGVRGTGTLQVAGLDRRYAESLIRINEQFPMGVDCLLLDAAGQVAALPRSTHLEVS